MSRCIRLESDVQLGCGGHLSLSYDRSCDPSNTTVIFCHGLTGDKVGPQRLLTRLSTHLVSTCQVNVLRFDFRGAGLSSGAFSDTTLQTMCQDAMYVAESIQGKLVWLGISTGALIAAMASAQRAQGEAVIAVSNGFAEQPEFSNIEEPLIPVRGGQLYLNRKFFLQRASLRPRTTLFPALSQLSLALGSQDHKHIKELEDLRRYKVRIRVFEGADHLFTNIKHRFELFSYLEEELHAIIGRHAVSNC